MVIILHREIISGKIARVEVNFRIHPGNKIFGCFPIGFFCIQIKGKRIILELKHVPGNNGTNNTRVCWFDVVKVLPGFKYSIFHHGFGLFNI